MPDNTDEIQNIARKYAYNHRYGNDAHNNQLTNAPISQEDEDNLRKLVNEHDEKSLSLRSIKIGNNVARVLASAKETNIEQLNIDYTNIGNAGAMAIAEGFPKLKKLDMQATQAGAEGITALIRKPGIKEIWMPQHYLGGNREDVATIANAVEESSLQKLSCYHCGLNNDLMVNAIQRSNTLINADLERNNHQGMDERQPEPFNARIAPTLERNRLRYNRSNDIYNFIQKKNGEDQGYVGRVQEELERNSAPQNGRQL